MDAPLKPPFSFRSVPAITCCRVHVESSKGRWTMLLNLHSPHRVATGFILAIFAVVVILAFSAAATAQTTISTGSIQGTITDPSGAVVYGAQITINNKATGQVVRTKSSSSGTYSSGALQPGNYVVQVEAKGFKTLELPVTVQVAVT